MNILLIAATEAEIDICKAHLSQSWQQSDKVFEKEGKRIMILITGVGMAATAYAVTKALCREKYDLALQVGVGGSFDRNIALGDVVFVTSERYGDLGAEDRENYLDIFDMGLLDKDVSPFVNGRLLNPLSSIHDDIALPQVSSLTVNMVSGKEATIQRLTAQYNCQVESMEGAAFHYVCLMEQVPFAQVRSISNYVTPRDRAAWKMKEAIIALNTWLIGFLEGHQK